MEILQTNHRLTLPEKELSEIASKLPHHRPRRFDGDEQLRDYPRNGRVEQAVVDRECGAIQDRVDGALREAMETLGPQERLALKMRFEDGFTVARIAAVLQEDQGRLYKRMANALKKLRSLLEDKAVSGQEMSELLGWENLTLQVNYGVERSEK